MADVRWYTQGPRPKVLINWQSFVDHGIPAAWRGPFTEAVINAYTRWMNVGGVDLRFQFWGYTDRTESNVGELVISMNDLHSGESRLASTFGNAFDRLFMVFHRRSGIDLTPWNFVPYNANPGELDMQGILIHEFGHCLGLDHSSGVNDTMNGNYDYHRQRYGPFADDVARLRAVYGVYRDNRLRQLHSLDAGASWSTVSNDITGSIEIDVRTNINPGVTPTPTSGLYLVGWTDPGTVPTWVRGDEATFLLNSRVFFGGERSVYGPAYACDDSGMMMWAWVTNDDLGTIRVVNSADDGLTWSFVGTPANARTFGTPALCWSRINGQSTWIIAWSHFDRDDHAATGRIRASVSTDGGGSWSDPAEIEGFYKVLSGVSLAAARGNNILLAFSWAPHGVYGMNAIRAIQCRVDAGMLRSQGLVYSDATTRIQPCVAFDRAGLRWVMAWREQDFNTSINVCSKNSSDVFWSDVVRPGVSSHVAPAMAYSLAHDRIVLWYAHDN